MELTIVLVSYNTRTLLEPCFAALDAARGRVGPSEVVVIDNASRDGSADYIEQNFPSVRLIRSKENVGFGRANNMVLAGFDSDFMLLLNTDAFVAPDSIEKAMAYMKSDERCGIVGVRLTGRDGAVQPSCRYFPTPWNMFLGRTGLARLFPGVRLVDGPDWAPPTTQECDWVPGCFYLIRRSVIEQVGLFDPRFFLYYEEVDHCLATQRAGWKIVYLPTTSVVHLGGESAKADSEVTKAGKQVDKINIESALLYFRKNFGFGALVAYVILESTSDFIVLLKGLLRRLDWRGAGHLLRRIATLGTLCTRTRFGMRPTR